MPICPTCNKRIEHLLENVKEINTYELRLDSNDELEYTQTDDKEAADDDDEEQYVCPNCWKIITNNEDDAYRFLKGEIIER